MDPTSMKAKGVQTQEKNKNKYMYKATFLGKNYHSAVPYDEQLKKGQSNLYLL